MVPALGEVCENRQSLSQLLSCPISCLSRWLSVVGIVVVVFALVVVRFALVVVGFALG